MLDPRRLLTFHAVARAGSFSAAARELSLTQPAVSQQVAALERELGARLLHRGPGGLTLTDAGAVALEHADALAERLAVADAQIAELRAHGGTLRVGGFPSALASVVPAAIPRLGAARRVEAVEGSWEQLAGGVSDGSLHVALCFQDVTLPRRERQGLRRHDLGTEPFLAVVGPGHRLAKRRRIRLRDLAGETWVAPSGAGIIYKACQAAGFEPDIAYVSQDILAMRALVAANLAVTVTPRLGAGEWHGVKLLDLDDAAPIRALFAITPRIGTTPAAREFLDVVRELL